MVNNYNANKNGVSVDVRWFHDTDDQERHLAEHLIRLLPADRSYYLFAQRKEADFGRGVDMEDGDWTEYFQLADVPGKDATPEEVREWCENLGQWDIVPHVYEDHYDDIENDEFGGKQLHRYIKEGGGVCHYGVEYADKFNPYNLAPWNSRHEECPHLELKDGYEFVKVSGHCQGDCAVVIREKVDDKYRRNADAFLENMMYGVCNYVGIMVDDEAVDGLHDLYDQYDFDREAFLDALEKSKLVSEDAMAEIRAIFPDEVSYSY